MHPLAVREQIDPVLHLLDKRVHQEYSQNLEKHRKSINKESLIGIRKHIPGRPVFHEGFKTIEEIEVYSNFVMDFSLWLSTLSQGKGTFLF